MRFALIRLAATLLCLLAGSALLRASDGVVITDVEVVEVCDGTSLRLETGAIVKYNGIAEPASAAEAQALFAANEALVGGQRVRIVFDTNTRDDTGRLLAYVFVDSTCVNAQLVYSGLAKYRYEPLNVRYQTEFLILEADARENRRGIWAAPQERAEK